MLPLQAIGELRAWRWMKRSFQRARACSGVVVTLRVGVVVDASGQSRRREQGVFRAPDHGPVDAPATELRAVPIDRPVEGPGVGLRLEEGESGAAHRSG